MAFGIDDVAGAVVGTGMGMLTAGYNDERQIRQQQKLQGMQVKGQKEMGKFNQDLQMDMWNKTNYGAQIGHMKDAGLNAGLMYGMGGAGGATTGSAGGNVSGATAVQGGGGEMMGGMQMALMNAQKENIEADTANKKAGATKTAGVDTELTKEDIEKRQADVLTQKEEFTKKAAESQFENRTLEDRIKQASFESAGAEIENEARKMGIKVDKARINQMAEQIAQGWEGLSQGEQRIKLETFRAELEANYPGVTKVLGRITDDGLETLFNLRQSGGRKQMKGVQ